ncbi:MAG: flagellar basal body P-ring protein FlgI [Acidobacteria bacterium]|nr:flagellar basal body P-ring protein FlgI [Acidobacteriota bacterium]
MLVLLLAAPLPAARLKDLGNWEGVRDNQLVGYGLVVGLAGTGDKRQTVFSAQSLTNLLERMGVTVNPAAIQVRNTASVMVTATLPPYAQPGNRIDTHVAAVGDATNLQGGLLVLTPLKAADGQVFAAAQGPVVTGGFSAGRGGNTQSLNHPTAGRIPNGAIIEKTAPSPAPSSRLRLQLRQADFTTAARIVEAINKKFSEGGPAVAKAENSALVTIDAPARYSTHPVQFVSELENLAVDADRRARIVINERTGTIVLGKEVRIAPVAILHGALSVEIQTTYDVSQPAPLSGGRTTVTPQTNVDVKEEKAKSIMLKNGATVEDLVKSLTAIGSTPRDIIAILQNLRAAGALEAELEVI